jgi:hypothetical protein
MKKRLSVFLLVFVLCASGAYSGPAVHFKGLIINISDTSIEIKKGVKEITLQWTDSSKVMRDGKELGRDSIELCQRVSAKYAARDGRTELITLEILSDGYCK